MTIQNYKFLIPFQIVPHLTRRFAILGDDLLSVINSSLHIGRKAMQFDIKNILLSAREDTCIEPESCNTLALDLPNSVTHVIPFKMKNKNLKASFLNSDNIEITNNSIDMIQIKKGDIIAETHGFYIDLYLLNILNSQVYYTDDDINDDKPSSNMVHRKWEYSDLLNSEIDNDISNDNNSDISDEYDVTNELDDNDRYTNLLNNESYTDMFDNYLDSRNDDTDTTDQWNKPEDMTINISPEQIGLNKKQVELINTLNSEQRLRYLDRCHKFKWLNHDDKRLYQSLDELIDDKFQTSNTLLDKSDQQLIRNMIKQNPDAFSFWGEIGCFKNHTIHLPFKEHESFAMRAYPINPKDRDMVESEILKWQQLGILVESDEPYDISAGFAVRKKSDQCRICVDLRRLNQMAVKLSYTLLNFELILKHISDEISAQDIGTDSTNRSIYISAIDISSAFNSIKVSKESRKYLGVSINGKVYELTTLPQGYVNSSVLFVRTMDKILRKHPSFMVNIFAYVDDVYIVNRDRNSHIRLLGEIFHLFAQEGVKLSLNKCEFATKEIVILGHKFTHTPQGLMMEPLKKRIDAINSIQIPTDRKKLRAFLGLMNYQSRYLKDFRRKAAKLYELTSKNLKYEFTDEHVKVFNEVKELVKGPMAIHVPNANFQKLVVVDSSNRGYGAVIYDYHVNEDGKEEKYVIGYDSKSYGDRRFDSSTEHEMFGLTSVINTYKYYLYGTHFYVYTDSRALVEIAKGNKTLQDHPKLLRLWEKIMNYNFTIQHKKALECKEMAMADTISRLDIKSDIEHPDIIRPVAYDRYLDYMPIEGEEQNLNTDEIGDTCLYNLRTERKKPDRYGYSEDDSEDESSNDDESNDETNEQNTKDQRQQQETGTKAQTELDKLIAEAGDTIPEFMIKPSRHLFEGATQDKVVIRNFPRQLDLNKFINDVLECCSNFSTTPIKRFELIAAQKSSIIYRELYRYLKLNVLPTSKQQIRQTLILAESNVLVNEVLCHVSTDKRTNDLRIRPVIPTDELALRLIHMTHTSAMLNHTGISSTFKILNEKYHIRNLLQLISSFVKSCIMCNLAREPPRNASTHDFKKCLAKSDVPLGFIYCDIKSIYPSPSGHQFLLVCLDAKTRFIMAQPLKDRTSKSIITAFLKIFTTFGFPNMIESDLESGIKANVTKSFLSFLGIKISFCQSMGHESNAAEPTIGRIMRRLQFLLAQKESHWVELTDLAVLAANSLKRTNGYSPNYLMFGRELCNVELIEDTDINYNLPTDEKEYINNLKQKFKEADAICKGIDFAEKTLQVSAHRSKISSIKGLSVFDFVYILSPQEAVYLKTNTLKIRYQKVGIVVVEEILHERLFRTRSLDNRSIKPIFHCNRLEKAYFLIQDKPISDLITLINEIKSKGSKNKESVLKKLEETKESILKINKDFKEEQINVDKESATNITDTCNITLEEQTCISGEVVKLKWSHGELFALMCLEDQKLRSWESIRNFPKAVRDKIMSTKIRTIGSLQKYKKQLGITGE